MPGTLAGTKIEIFMARRIRSRLEHRSSRLALPIRGKPYWLQIGDGLHQGYRRCQGNGSWSGRKSDGRGGNFIKRVGPSDDYENVPGALDYWQAQQKIRELFVGDTSPDSGKLVTVAQALTEWKADLKARGGHEGNATVVEYHLTPTLRTKIVAALSARELIAWRNNLLEKGLKPSSVTRVCKSFAAALSLAARHDARITNASAWKTGLEALPDSGVSRNVVVPDDGVRRIVRAGYEIGPALGLFLETAALTGSRPVQLRRLTVGDVLKDKLAMPSSKKGKGKRRIERKSIPIPLDLAARLRVFAKGRPADALLFIRDDGSPWPINHRDIIRDVMRRAGLDPDRVSLYSLRHTWITKQLIRGTPIRLVADAADTSIQMIEATYSKHISHHGDDLLRAGLIDLTVPIANKVVPLR
jgi:integrase